MDRELRQRVRVRAMHRCEYCRLKQEHEIENAFHIEHIIAQQHGGEDDFENLALACSWCNAIKGPNLASLDPDAGALTRLYHPRKDGWEAHFRRDGAYILGVTDVGRTTAWLLQFNEQANLDQRTLLLELGELD
ncbi:MAG: HNH endonuclease [Prosthecobacter sp.]|uniref:HNH endonuclease n=1 Tax=Prosthecobacter sp. TaxID=1965333 RepID=UPI0038FE20FF